MWHFPACDRSAVQVFFSDKPRTATTVRELPDGTLVNTAEKTPTQYLSEIPADKKGDLISKDSDWFKQTEAVRPCGHACTPVHTCQVATSNDAACELLSAAPL
jgi:hypothetical protein